MLHMLCSRGCNIPESIGTAQFFVGFGTQAVIRQQLNMVEPLQTCTKFADPL